MAKIFNDTNAIEALRSSDFDAVSAYGEVVDNAIQAGAKNIRIHSSLKEGKRGYHTFERLAFIDDGVGMSMEILANCMTIGWSSRYNSREGIGRFGVGMTMAAIHECKRVEAYSKCQGGDWHYTYIDLDEIKEGAADEIPAPKKRKMPSDLAQLAPRNNGTVIVWSKYDRQRDNAIKHLDEARIWMGRVYRYFIWEQNVSIEIDGKEVKAIDPLYCRLEKTEFPNDTTGSVFKEIEIEWPVDKHDAPANSPESSPIKIKLSLLPEFLRPERFQGNSQQMRQRHMDKNEGISILRNKREVFYGHIPYWSAAGSGWPHFEEIDRYWGCEIHFDAVLDRAFEVKNIKRGAVPSKQLKENIKSLIMPTRETCLVEIRKLWDENKKSKKLQEARGQDKAKRVGNHEHAERIVKKAPNDTPVIDEDKDFEAEVELYTKNLGDQYDDEQKAALKNIFKNQPFSIMEESWNGTGFFESHHLGGKAVLEYNMRHPFFETVYKVFDDLEKSEDPYSAAKHLKTLLDLLILAFAKAESRFGLNQEMEASEFLELLRSNWGQYLGNFVKTWSKTRSEE